MKTIIGIASALMISAPCGFTQDANPQNEKPVEFTFDFKSYYKSEYVSPFGKLVFDGPVVQSQLTIWAKFNEIPGKFYFDFWSSYGLKKWNTNSGDELNYSLGWKGELFDGINLNVWATYLDFLPVGEMTDKGDHIRFFAEIDRKFNYKLQSIFSGEETPLSITPYICFEVPYALQGDKGIAGLRTYLGAKTGWEFLPNWFLSSRVNLFLDDGASGLQPGTFLDCRTGISWQVNKWLNIEPLNVRMITPLASRSDGRERQTIWSGGLNFKF